MIGGILNWLLMGLVLLDQAVNWLLGGSPDETLSSRAHRMREKGQPVWGWAADAIDWLFFWETGHCRKAYESEVRRRQLPEHFWSTARR